MLVLSAFININVKIIINKIRKIKVFIHEQIDLFIIFNLLEGDLIIYHEFIIQFIFVNNRNNLIK